MKIFHIITLITFLISFFLLCLVGYWLLYPYKPLIINRVPVPVNPKIVHKSGQVVLTMDYCKYMDIQPEIEKQFIDSLIFNTPIVTPNNPTGCHIVNVKVDIPIGLPEEKYKIVQTITYRVNPLRSISYKVESEPFQIIN